jgi:Domain of unknown function (DUF4411)
VYLLDANVLITANAQYYAVDRVPEYWDWLRHMAAAGHVKMPVEIYEEVQDGPSNEKDLVYAWLQEPETKKAILLPDKVDVGLVRKIMVEGYAPDLTDDQVERVGRDPFLIAHGLATGRCIVTAETSEPKKQRHNRKIPDVCDGFGVKWCEPHKFNRNLDFSTAWKQKLGIA